MVLATLYALLQDKQIDAKLVEQAITDLKIDTEKPNPATT
jgi:pyruvate dehydrogenase complex dehydrogenase (E1) component